MKAQHQFDSQTLMEQARNILRQNDRGGYTVPTERLYPYQWNWDSAICALGWQSFDEARAWKEIRMLLKGQWSNGMLPHIVFHQDSPDYFPNADVWNVSEACFPHGGRAPSHLRDQSAPGVGHLCP